jgi:chromosome partitioning protein
MSPRHINDNTFRPAFAGERGRIMEKSVNKGGAKSARTIAVANRKGGVGKTMTAVSLAAGLAREGQRVLCVDADSQGSMSVSLGVTEPDKLATTLATALTHIYNEEDFNPLDGVVKHPEGVDLIPANSNLAALEISLAGLIGRETVLRQYVEKVKPLYDFIIIDTSPSLDLMTINALAAADEIIITVCPKFLDAKGLELLLKSVAQIRRQINPTLVIDGILLTMVDRRANFTQTVIASIDVMVSLSILNLRIRRFQNCFLASEDFISIEVIPRYAEK